jgi:hypothetical protein
VLARAVVRFTRPGEPASTLEHGGAGAAGLVAAAIVAGAPPLVAYSANARGYSIVLLLMVGQLLLTLRLAERSTSKHLIAWVACGALAIWTVPTAILGVGVAAFWLVALRGGPAKRLLAPAAAVAATGGVALALYAPVLGQRGFTVDRFTAAPIKDLATTLAHAWGAGRAAPLIVAAVVLAIVGLAADATRRSSPAEADAAGKEGRDEPAPGTTARFGPAARLAFALLVVPAAIVVLGRVLPYSRTYLFLLPILAVLAGVGAASLLPQRARLGRRGPFDDAGRAALVAVTVLALIAGATSQTREAWAEDPPGPSPSGLGKLIDEQGVPIGAGRVAVPAFDRPQVLYAVVGGGTAEEVASRRAITGDLERPIDPDAKLFVLTRAAVSPREALEALALAPEGFTTTTVVRDDARLVVATPR